MVERLLVEQDQTQTEVAEVLTFYEDDIDRATLLAQLQLFRTNFLVEQKKTLHYVVSIIEGMSVGERAILS